MLDYLYPGLLLLGVVLLLTAGWFYANTARLLAEGMVVEGSVIDLIESSSRDGYMYKPVFEFTDHNNSKVTFEASYSSSPPTHNIGEQVNIIYSINDNTKKVVPFWGLYRWTIITLCLASPLLIIGLGHLLYSRSVY